MKRNSVNSFDAIIALSLLIICLFFLKGEKNRERDRVMATKKYTEFRFIIKRISHTVKTALVYIRSICLYKELSHYAVRNKDDLDCLINLRLRFWSL